MRGKRGEGERGERGEGRDMSSNIRK